MRDTISEMLRREPFEPFHLVLTSGDQVTIHDPQLAALMENRIFVAELRSNAYTFVRLNQIAAVNAGSAAA